MAPRGEATRKIQAVIYVVCGFTLLAVLAFGGHEMAFTPRLEYLVGGIGFLGLAIDRIVVIRKSRADHTKGFANAGSKQT